ncbi:MAG TPA: family 20 glycosylhydrolase, partial [Candidatus Ruthenibacterium avium]|nr:family 20 glycosylhydrolase [Candidatus Ruthenibacterium avium]
MGFQTTDVKLIQALSAVQQFVPMYGLPDHLMIYVEYHSDAAMSWRRENDELFLRCSGVGQALMLLGRALTLHDRSAESLIPRLDQLGAMLDVSRNSVYTLPTMKKFLCQLALMGYTECYLYMEDTYELPGYPYFGYRRGRYSVQEQKELDDFAALVGIELIPCIQTLAHLRTAIRWKYMQPMRDTVDNLMVGQEETRELVEAMISHFSKTFRTRRIHLGMDEAVSLGTGRYRLYKGYRDHRD